MAERTVEERVATGAAWLDTNYPGWERCIDLTELEMAESCHCILGQSVSTFAWDKLLNFTKSLYGDDDDEDEVDPRTSWIAVTHAMGMTWPLAVDGGFQAGLENRDEEAYDKLDQAWTNLIKDRFDRGDLSG